MQEKFFCGSHLRLSTIFWHLTLHPVASARLRHSSGQGTENRDDSSEIVSGLLGRAVYFDSFGANPVQRTESARTALGARQKPHESKSRPLYRFL